MSAPRPHFLSRSSRLVRSSARRRGAGGGDGPRRHGPGGAARRRRRLLLRLLAAALAAAALSGCQAAVDVEVRARADGTGRVEARVSLDEEAAAQVPDLAQQLRVDDLRAGGWRVEGPTPTEGGGTELRAVKRFRSPAGASRALAEVSGPGGPFASLRLSQRRSLWKTRTALTGTVDLSRGLESFGDEVVKERLGGHVLGADPAELERQLGMALSRVFRFRLLARLPGAVRSDAPLQEGGAAVWPVELGATQTVAASSERWNVANLLFAAVAVAAALALLVVLVRRSRHVSWG